jgi:hypothetical protein
VFRKFLINPFIRTESHGGSIECQTAWRFVTWRSNSLFGRRTYNSKRGVVESRYLLEGFKFFGFLDSKLQVVTFCNLIG